MLIIRHAISRDDVFLGMVRAEGIETARYPEDFDARLQQVVAERAAPLGEIEEARRAAARNILRNGSYKPTGRGKPASEYLLRAASQPEYVFPRINAPVDICNYLSLRCVLPISLWDLDRAASDQYVFRLGREGEGFAFNHAGQRIDVKDLLCGCRVAGNDSDAASSDGEPIVNPVRDSMATKTTPDTRRIAACVYAPSAAMSEEALQEMCEEFAALLSACGTDTQTACGVVLPQAVVEM
ncbi:MAG: hypothetical protein F4Y00_10925 [Bacteroidetes bacterium SB0662_bin_6]|nr:hypothetical protein [Bacteroidetes bacterium SB0668_bin_1]MYE05469.1 hypothetical protein [Bacteroidetes bacterium SB0662_bin_6]